MRYHVIPTQGGYMVVDDQERLCHSTGNRAEAKGVAKFLQGAATAYKDGVQAWVERHGWVRPRKTRRSY